MGLLDFFSLPMTSGPRDWPTGVDELDNVAYSTPRGDRYTVKERQARRESVVRGVMDAVTADPVGFGKNALLGVADGVWQGVSAPGRAASGEPVTYGDAAELAGMVSLPALAGRYDPAVANMGIHAYHGSPHDFDRFSMDKIGTGEGAQAYGHGLYFAEAEDVARQYRDALAPGMGDGALRAVGVSDGDLRSMRQFTQSGVDPDVALRDWLGWTGKKETPELRAAFMQEWGARDPGHMYEVNINADPADFLDWDAPLSEQPQKVREIAETTLAGKRPTKWVFNGYNGGYTQPMPGGGHKKIGDVTNTMPGQYRVRIGKEDIGTVGSAEAAKLLLDRELTARGKMPEQIFNPKGKDVYAELVGGIDSLVHESPNRVGGTEQLAAKGIPGIKYYDGMSRAGGEGTRNYVVFDENLIDIVRKYGWAAAAPLFANQLAPQEQQGIMQ